MYVYVTTSDLEKSFSFDRAVEIAPQGLGIDAIQIDSLGHIRFTSNLPLQLCLSLCLVPFPRYYQILTKICKGRIMNHVLDGVEVPQCVDFARRWA